MTLGDVIRSGLSAFRGRPGGRRWLLRLLELGFGLSALFRMLGQGGLLSGEVYYGLRRAEVGRLGAILSRPRRRTLLPPTRVPRFQKQRVFHLSGCAIDAAAVLRSEDHQLSGLMPGTAVLDMLGLLQDTPSHVSEPDKPSAILEHNRAGELADHTQTVFIGEWVRTTALPVMVWLRRITANQIASCFASPRFRM